ncbi:hypothetical protein Tco_0937593 [Tanacetum coccineum]|uniref:Uncharacterized protein n=1 Tax=Tanacetum coccineum TaxID=301880 RepID=A0ABQ5DGP1_9ASTR
MADDDEYTIIYRKPKAITPDLPAEEPDNSLSMRDEHLNTIPEMEKSSVENLVPIPSDSKGIDDDDFDEEEGEIDIDLFLIEDEILREKLLNVIFSIVNIEA